MLFLYKWYAPDQEDEAYIKDKWSLRENIIVKKDNCGDKYQKPNESKHSFQWKLAIFPV